LLLEFCSKKDLESFLEEKKIHVWGRNILVSPYLTGEARKRKQQSLQKRRLFVKNIPLNWNTDRLIREFSKFGEIQQAYIVDKPQYPQNDATNNNKKTKFGYVITKDEKLSLKLSSLKMIAIGNVELSIQKHREMTNKFVFNKKQPNSRKNNRKFRNNEMGTKQFNKDIIQEFEDFKKFKKSRKNNMKIQKPPSYGSTNDSSNSPSQSPLHQHMLPQAAYSHPNFYQNSQQFYQKYNNIPYSNTAVPKFPKYSLQTIPNCIPSSYNRYTYGPNYSTQPMMGNIPAYGCGH
jgi:hypothetical protein